MKQIKILDDIISDFNKLFFLEFLKDLFDEKRPNYLKLLV